ncbi:hypothetical protein EAS64_25920 [Trebonia kvetii]|uniref:Uncharacterized protein n=1 Tax=Trebonia kvetii TaxID=2480626 RepID=A0A6P2BT60_9ACTN|nr:hypothetical protein [Trebonia kvetii]TVZ02262.1 hypothetical protein EAS64_25920 [Trebonia kvetii]
MLALVILFAVYALFASGLEAVGAFSSAKAGPVLGHLLLGLVDLAAGTVATLHSAVRETDLADAKPSPVHAPFRRPVHQ